MHSSPPTPAGPPFLVCTILLGYLESTMHPKRSDTKEVRTPGLWGFQGADDPPSWSLALASSAWFKEIMNVVLGFCFLGACKWSRFDPRPPYVPEGGCVLFS